MSYLAQLRELNPQLNKYSDETIISRLPQIDPQRFGKIESKDLPAVAQMDDREFEIWNYEQQGGGIGSSFERGLEFLNQTRYAAGAAVGTKVLDMLPERYRNTDFGQYLENQRDQDVFNLLKSGEFASQLPQRPELQRSVEAADKVMAEGGNAAGAVYAFVKEMNDSPDTWGAVRDLVAEQGPNLALQAVLAYATRGKSLAGNMAGFGVASGVSSGAMTLGTNTNKGLEGKSFEESLAAFDDAFGKALKGTAAQASIDAAVGAMVPVKIGNVGTNIVAQGLLQSAGGGGGEYARATAMGEEVSAGEIIAESVLELITTPVDVATTLLQETKASTDSIAPPIAPQNAPSPTQPTNPVQQGAKERIDAAANQTDDPLKNQVNAAGQTAVEASTGALHSPVKAAQEEQTDDAEATQNRIANLLDQRQRLLDQLDDEADFDWQMTISESLDEVEARLTEMGVDYEQAQGQQAADFNRQMIENYGVESVPVQPMQVGVGNPNLGQMPQQETSALDLPAGVVQDSAQNTQIVADNEQNAALKVNTEAGAIDPMADEFVSEEMRADAENAKPVTKSRMPIDALRTIADNGGIASATTDFDRADMLAVNKLTRRTVFNIANPNKGMTLDHAGEFLAQDSYFADSDDRVGSVTKLLEQIIRDPKRKIFEMDDMAEAQGQKSVAEQERIGLQEQRVFDAAERLTEDGSFNREYAEDLMVAMITEGFSVAQIEAMIDASESVADFMLQFDNRYNRGAFNEQERVSDGDEGSTSGSREEIPEWGAQGDGDLSWLEEGETETESEPLLTSYSEQDLRDRDRQISDAQAQEQADQKAAEQKAQADAEVNNFNLSGSDRPADTQTAGGAMDMFGATPREQAATLISEPEREADADREYWEGKLREADSNIMAGIEARDTGDRYDYEYYSETLGDAQVEFDGIRADAEEAGYTFEDSEFMHLAYDEAMQDNRTIPEIRERMENINGIHMLADGSTIFEPPARPANAINEAKVYHKDAGWMTVEEAKAKWAEWDANAKSQKGNASNYKRVVLSLFDLTGKMAQPWVDAGYTVYTFDIQNDFKSDMKKVKDVKDLGGSPGSLNDVLEWNAQRLADLVNHFDGADVHAIFAFCPCTDFAGAGARWMEQKDLNGDTLKSVQIVEQTQAIIEFYRPAVWMIENPVGRIHKLTSLPKPNLKFSPNSYGDPYKKETWIWGRFNNQLPLAPVDPTEGSKAHVLWGGNQYNKNLRSETPEGFAKAFFQANNFLDHQLQTLKWNYDRFDWSGDDKDLSDLVDRLIAADVEVDEIWDTMAEGYYGAGTDKEQVVSDLKAEYSEELARAAIEQAGEEQAEPEAKPAKKSFKKDKYFSDMAMAQRYIKEHNKQGIYYPYKSGKRITLVELGKEYMEKVREVPFQFNNVWDDRPKTINEYGGKALRTYLTHPRLSGDGVKNILLSYGVSSPEPMPVGIERNGVQVWQDVVQTLLEGGLLVEVGKFEESSIVEDYDEAVEKAKPLSSKYEAEREAAAAKKKELDDIIEGAVVRNEVIRVIQDLELLVADGSVAKLDQAALLMNITKKSGSEKLSERKARYARNLRTMRKIEALRSKLDTLTVDDLKELHKDSGAKKTPSSMGKKQLVEAVAARVDGLIGNVGDAQNKEKLRAKLKQQMENNEPINLAEYDSLSSKENQSGTYVYTMGDRDAAKQLGLKTINPPGQRGTDEWYFERAERYVEDPLAFFESEKISKKGYAKFIERAVQSDTVAGSISELLLASAFDDIGLNVPASSTNIADLILEINDRPEWLEAKAKYQAGLKEKSSEEYRYVKKPLRERIGTIEQSDRNGDATGKKLTLADGWQTKEGETIVYVSSDRGVNQALEAAVKTDKKREQPKDKLDEIRAAMGEKEKDAWADVAALFKKQSGKLNSGIDPELALAVAKAGAYTVAKGSMDIASWLRDVVRNLMAVGVPEETIKDALPTLKQAYGAIQTDPESFGLSEDTVDLMSSPKQVRKYDMEQQLQRTIDNVKRTDRDPRTDRTDRTDEKRNALQDSDDAGSGRSGSDADGSSAEVEGAGDATLRPRNGDAATQGERGDISSGLEKIKSEADSARDFDDRRSSESSIGGISADESRATEAGVNTAANNEAGVTPLEEGAALVKKQMPFLLNGQANDVVAAENRFAQPEGYGVLFTNGTGTGKTFSGMGVVKRHVDADLDARVLIVVPSQTIAQQWVDAGSEFFKERIYTLKDTKDSGTRTGDQVVITTFANFTSNNNLIEQDWTMVVMDEAHKLSASSSGSTTGALKKMHALTKKPESYRTRAQMANPELYEELDFLREELEETNKRNQPTYKLDDMISDLMEKIRKLENEEADKLKGLAPESLPRALLLSASPFAYRESVKWANGYLFDWGVNEQRSYGYNEPDAMQQFFINHFGYRMRNNKLTAPDAQVDLDLMERTFNTWLRKQGVLFSRQLDTDFDYDRLFVQTESALGEMVDDAMKWIGEAKRSDDNELKDAATQLDAKIDQQFKGNGKHYFLEALKAQESIEHIKAHLAQGRKVLVLHKFHKGGAVNPFRIEDFTGMNTGARNFYKQFQERYKPLIEGFDTLEAPIEQLQRAFPDLVLFNGKVSTKKKQEAVESFNSDKEGSAQLMLAQGAAMREGVSMHDKTGKSQRVLIQLGLPTEPTASIQQEGRIFRVGQASNAMFRYFTIGTNWERTAFAKTIASRAGTAENLGMGEEARGLKNAFVYGYETADVYEPGFDGEGVGGKESDRLMVKALTPWDSARAMYYANGKKKKGRSASDREHSEYFATPEPIGMKMVQWLDSRPNERLLEPSAGHGAIAQWMPDNTSNVAVEPTTALSSRLALRFNGTIREETFEEMNIINKFDGIVMNPPFGVQSKMAADHVKKAMGHMKEGGRLVALIPTGPAADKRFEALFYGEDMDKSITQVGEVILPRVTFERAGTQVPSRIVIFEKISNEEVRNTKQVRTYDFSDETKIEDLFDRLEDLDFDPRSEVQATPKKAAKRAAVSEPSGGIGITVKDGLHKKTGQTLYLANADRSLNDDEYQTVKAVAKKYGGFWSRYDKAFRFESPELRQDFVSEVTTVKYSLGAAAAGVDAKSIETAFPQVEVVQSASDLPQSIQSGADSRTIKGAFHNGKVYLVAGNLSNMEEVERTIYHEMTHAGLNQMLDDRTIKAALNQLWVAMGGRKGFEKVAAALGADMSAYLDRATGMTEQQAVPMLVEELLARASENDVRPNIMQRIKAFIGAVRAYLANKGFIKLSKVGDADIAYLARSARERAMGLGDAVNASNILYRQGTAGTARGKLYSTLGNKDRSVMDKARRFFKRRFTAGGLLPENIFKMKIERDSEVNNHIFDENHYNARLDTAIKEGYGKSHALLTDAQKKLLDDFFKGEQQDADIPVNVKAVIFEMRIAMSGLSQEYADILKRQRDDLMADFDEADMVLFEALLNMRDVEPTSKKRGAKAAATRKRNAILKKAKADYKEITEGKGNIKAALTRANEAASKHALMQTIIDNLDTYAHRSYRAFDDADWPKKVPAEVVEKARVYLENRIWEEAEERNKDISEVEVEEQAQRIIRTILEEGTAYDSIVSFISESKLGAKDLSILKKRKDIDPAIRALMGEYRDIKINFSKSMEKMARLVANTKLLERMTEFGLANELLFTKNNKPTDRSVTLIAGDKSEVYSPLNGLYAENDFHTALIDALGKSNLPEWIQTVIRANGMVKYGKTVLSPTTAFRNFMSGYFFTVANGHFDYSKLKKSWEAKKEYFSHDGEKRKLEYLKKLKRLGVVYDTTAAGEIIDLLKESKFEHTLFEMRGFKGAAAFNDFAQKFYSMGDDWWKIMGWENEVDALMKHQGMSRDKAEIEAAERIRNTYPTYSLTSDAVQFLRRFPLVGTFVSFPAEIIRTQYHMLRYMAQDYKAGHKKYVARKMVGYMLVSGLAYAAQAISKDIFDVGDDEEEAIRMMSASWNENSNLIFLGRDNEGNVQYLDISFLDPYAYGKKALNAILRDQPLDDAMLQVGRELSMPFLGQDIAAAAITEVLMNKRSTGSQIFNPADSILGQTKSIASHLATALEPGGFKSLQNFYKAFNGHVRRSGREYDLAEETAAFFGWRATTFAPERALYYNAFEFKDDKANATRLLSDVARDPNVVTDADLRTAAVTAEKAHNEAYAKLARLVNAAKAAGMSDKEVTKALKLSGVAKRDIKAVLAGEIPEWKPSKRSLERTIKKMDLLFSDEYRERMERRRDSLLGIE